MEKEMTIRLQNLDSRIAPKEPTVGQMIEFDQGAFYELLPCTDWDRAQFRIPVKHLQIAVNVRITGTMVHRTAACYPRIRCEVEFVGDGEPSRFERAWLHLHVDGWVNYHK
jgi:hypothetical protein